MAGQVSVDWLTCVEDECIGICLNVSNKCLAHASEEATAAALKVIGETGSIDARGVHITADLFHRIIIAAPRGENNKPLIKDCEFDRATFTGDAIFSGAIFTGDAIFSGVTFTGDAGFTSATFTGDAIFSDATFTGRAGFGGATFPGDARFDRVTFSGGADFSRATFSGNAVFSGVIFTGVADFSRATFTGGAGFFGTTFTGAAWFDRVTFTVDVGFHRATFTGAAGFFRATFTGDAWFGGATFTESAWFFGTTFTGDAVFSGVTFTGVADFSRATFTGGAGFDGATFKRLANFEGVRFEQARQFGPLLAYRGLVLDDVQFELPVQIEVSSTGVCCRRARFPGGAQFRLRWARVVLDDSDLAAPSILAGVPPPDVGGVAEGEEQIARAWRRLLAEEISERPQLLSLRRANVAGLTLSNVSADHCRFDGAHNLDKLRLESGVSFAAAALPAHLAGRAVIAEERAWRARRSRRWAAPMWPGWPGDEPAVLDPGQIAGLYRALRKGREDSKDEPGAADFYYGEMEMRRRAHRTQNPGQQTGAISRGAAEHGILTAYWLVSGYSLRAWRAVAALAVVTALFAVAFYQVGFAVPPSPASYWTSLLYAFRATLSLTDDQVKLTVWGQLLQGILRLTGPVLLGLALLALRNRVKR